MEGDTVVSDETTVLCGSCECPVEAPSGADPDYEIISTGCGQRDRLDDVLRSVAEYIASRAAKRLGRAIGQGMTGNSFVKFERQPTPNRSVRWVAE
jgi:hypothetical protein